MMKSAVCTGKTMAWLLAAGLSASVFLAGPPAAMAQVNFPPQGTITTQGHGEVKARPDSLNVQVTVESREATLADARAINNKKMKAVTDALKSLNFARLKLETQNLNVYPIQGEAQRDKLPKTIGYQATNGLSVTVTGAPPDALGEYASRIVDIALNTGANNVSGMSFFLDDLTAARTQALQLAVEDARRNAEAMARASNVLLTGLYSLEGSPQFGGFPRPVPMYAMKAGAPAAEMAQTPVETGETTITGDVTARFKF